MARCISCGKITPFIYKDGFCVLCKKGYGGQAVEKKVPKIRQFDHLKGQQLKRVLDEIDKGEISN
jgi:hypothetical protein